MPQNAGKSLYLNRTINVQLKTCGLLVNAANYDGQANSKFLFGFFHIQFFYENVIAIKCITNSKLVELAYVSFFF